MVAATLIVEDALSPLVPVTVTVYGPAAPAAIMNWVPSNDAPLLRSEHPVAPEKRPPGVELSVHVLSPLLKTVPATKLTYTVTPGVTVPDMAAPGYDVPVPS